MRALRPPNNVDQQLKQEIAKRKHLELKLAEYAKRLEAKVVGRMRDIEDARTYAESIVQTLREFLVVLDRKLRIVFANRTFYESFHAAPEETEGRMLYEFGRRQWDIPKLKQLLAAVIAKNRTMKGFEVAKAFPVIGYRVMLLNARALERGEGYPPLILLSIEDITERKRTEARIRELNELRNKFIQIVSHQLRTPLNAIRWNLALLISGDLGKLKKVQKEFVRLSYEASLGVIRRIHDMLTAMDIEEGRVVVDRQEISLESLWGSVMVEWRKQCTIKELVCEYRAPESPLPPVAVDAEKIREVFTKLAENALIYTPEKGRIAIELKKTNGNIRFEISDTGIGIPKAEQLRIFTRFFRATNAPLMKPDASGIGLSIAKFFVEQHGGKMGFQSTEGKGSTFWFEIPIG